MSKKHEQLAQAVDEVLYYRWDPIGVKDHPSTRDEYRSYVRGVVAMLESGADERRVAEHLTALTETSMGLTRDHSHARQVAELLVRWRDMLAE